MSSTLSEIEQQAMQLAPGERAVLAEHLINSLDEVDHAEIERLWAEEGERRYEAYRQGR